MRMEVTLPVELWQEGKRIGNRRYLRAKRYGYEDSFGKDSLKAHIHGALGEAAFALAMGLAWPHDRSIDGFNAIADVLPNWEVRTTSKLTGMKVRRSCELNPRPRYCDSPSRLVGFVLNAEGAALFKMIGYVVADWAQRNRPLTDPGNLKRPAHFVRMSDIAPFTPDFHHTHGWVRDQQSPSGWACAYCPTNYEGATP